MLSIVVGCADNSVSPEMLLRGRYKITAMQSSVAVDANNDGLATINLYSEISGPHVLSDGSTISFYDFEGIQNRMEMRPLPETTNDARLVDFNIPDQYIGQLTSGEYFLSMYLHSGYGYTYELDSNTNLIKLTRISDFVENGTLNTFRVIDDGILKLEMTKQIFDFKTQRWLQADLTITYEKVE